MRFGDPETVDGHVNGQEEDCIRVEVGNTLNSPGRLDSADSAAAWRTPIVSDAVVCSPERCRDQNKKCGQKGESHTHDSHVEPPLRAVIAARFTPRS